MKFYIFILLRQRKLEESFIIFKLRSTALHKQIELVRISISKNYMISENFWKRTTG